MKCHLCSSILTLFSLDCHNTPNLHLLLPSSQKQHHSPPQQASLSTLSRITQTKHKPLPILSTQNLLVREYNSCKKKKTKCKPKQNKIYLSKAFEFHSISTKSYSTVLEITKLPSRTTTKKDKHKLSNKIKTKLRRYHKPNPQKPK